MPNTDLETKTDHTRQKVPNTDQETKTDHTRQKVPNTDQENTDQICRFQPYQQPGSGTTYAVADQIQPRSSTSSTDTALLTPVSHTISPVPVLLILVARFR